LEDPKLQQLEVNPENPSIPRLASDIPLCIIEAIPLSRNATSKLWRQLSV